MTTELIATCWTNAGAAKPLSADERSPETFEARVSAVAAAGFSGLGLLHADLVTIRDEAGYAYMRDVLSGHAIKHVELEMLVDWFATGAARQRSDQVRSDLFEAARELSARHIKVGGDYSGVEWPFDLMVTEFATLCEQAADVGVRIALEPIAFANIATPNDGVELVYAAGHPAGGLMLDNWHVERNGLPTSSIADIPVELIVATEIDDGIDQVVGSLLEDTINERRLPGEGTFDIKGFIAAVKQTGYVGPWGVEILSTEFRNRPLVEAVAAAHDAAARMFQ